MKAIRSTPYARLPRAYRESHVIGTTVDAYGRAHWVAAGPTPYEGVIVTVDAGRTEETHLSAVLPRHARVDALPDGGFVIADTGGGVRVFDALGRLSWTFGVGYGVEYLLTDTAGDLWVGYFDEGIYSGDPLSGAGLRRWSSTGEPLWACKAPPGVADIWDICSLNVGTNGVWSSPYGGAPLLEIRDDGVRVRTGPVRGAMALAVHGDLAVFLSGNGEDADLLTYCRLTPATAEPVSRGRFRRADGSTPFRHQRICRGSRMYVRHEPSPDWEVLDIAG
ncbi:hypothetical protein [Streptomyces sp. CB03238]|uniref:hypothetical protein n=1 Tax=Streptomyces sp. CB03238 TaxID=1907777 RepID=UPI000A11AD33|nr:hypothetical protein [Streptomyces sp. CB03238]ORT54101.1 hypothetical protein BKD26_36185 [Streptomyces sp. CB03238]